MKNFFLLIFVLFFILLSFLIIGNKYEGNIYESNTVLKEAPIENKGVFISYIELNKYIKNKSEKDSKQNIINMLDNLKENNFNLLILQVRAFSDSIYDSDIFPTAYYILNKNNKPSYDILDFFIKESHKRNIDVHAWVNPYRVSSDEKIENIKKDNPAYNFIYNKCVQEVKNKGVYYNPACSEVTDLITSGIEEIVKKYDVDGIHFDDYFYPSKEIDKDLYEEYKASGGDKSINEYRYSVILNMIKNVNKTIKNNKQNVVFGISPEGNINNDYNNHFLDVKTILSSNEFIDYIMPQIYFGFENEYKPFESVLDEWNDLITKDIKLLPALAFYKTGKHDKYAGEGENEWIENSDIISRQIELSRKKSNYSGFSLFRYDSIFDNKNKISKEEFKVLQNILD